MKKQFVLASFILLGACQQNANKESSAVKTENLSASVTNEKKETTADVAEEPKKIKGDFNGDGKTEEMWLVEPKIKGEEMDCEGACDCEIVFSDKSIPSIKFESCIGGTPVNEGDLNGKPGDEIGLLPQWFTSCWRSYRVMTLSKNQWINTVEPISTHCDQWEQGIHPIKKLDKNGKVEVHYTEMDPESGFLMKKKVVTAK